MLQFAQKQGHVKRKALLVNAKGGLDFEAIKNDVPVEGPQPLPGDAFERMKADPELIAIKKRFAWGVGAQVRFGSLPARAEYERFKVLADQDIGMVSLSVSWTFF